jgi:DNA-binding MarR family transcriptional regulator
MPSKKPRLFHLLSLAQHRLLKAVDNAFKEEVGIGGTQLSVLWFLERNPDAMLKQVSDQLGINPSATTALIGRMEDAGLVRREVSGDDGRAVRIHATADGLGRAAAARPVLAKLNARLTQDFSERDVATVARFLDSILTRF